jgi:RimJ/RimL family protein N-acetyltransferase
LFEYLFKIVGIPAGYAKTVDDNEGIEKVLRGLQFEKINSVRQGCASFPEYRYISLHRGLSRLFPEQGDRRRLPGDIVLLR